MALLLALCYTRKVVEGQAHMNSAFGYQFQRKSALGALGRFAVWASSSLVHTWGTMQFIPQLCRVLQPLFLLFSMLFMQSHVRKAGQELLKQCVDRADRATSTKESIAFEQHYRFLGRIKLEPIFSFDFQLTGWRLFRVDTESLILIAIFILDDLFPNPVQ